jgi:membrane protease YdiL (CAAX protease family)
VQSAIGQHFKSPRARQFAVVLGLATVATDLVLVTQHVYYDARLALSLTAFAAIIYLTDGDLRSVGLRLSPKQGWRPWVRISVAIYLIVAACIALGLGIWHLTGHEIPIYSISPAQINPSILRMCFVAPVMEEAIYRVIVCVSLVNVFGCWKTIAVNGVLFGMLHVVYGNPSPENLVGGFFLAWVYLKSETILLPVILHSLGNFIALLGQVAMWHFLVAPAGAYG